MLKKLLILLLCPFFLCSCTNGAKEIVTFSSWGSITETKILKSVIENFEKDNPEIKINFMHIPQNYFQKIHLLFASSTPPDVIFINNLYLPVYMDELEDVSNLINKKDFYTQSTEALSYNGRLLAVPRDISNFVFFYNKNLVPKNFNKNWTFQEFVNTINSNPQKPCYKVSYERDIYWAEPYIMTLGRNEGIEFYKHLEGKYAPKPSEIGSSTLAQMFLDGKIMFYMSGRWMYPKIKETAEFPWDIITFPGIVPADASGWAISKKSKHKKNAEIFVKYLASQECIEDFAKSGLIVPARKNIKFEDDKIFNEAITKSRAHTVDKAYRKERDKLNKELFN